MMTIAGLQLGQPATTRGRVVAHGVKWYKQHTRSIYELILDDGTARLHCRWWNLPFMENHFATGDEVVVFGKPVSLKPRTMDHPETEIIEGGDASRMAGVKRVHGDEDLDNFDPATWFDAVQVPLAGTPSAFSLTPVPADGATGVVISANLTLTFTNALQGGREAGITLINLDTQAPVAVARTINDARTVVTLNPSSNLGASTDYAIIVHDVVDIHGQALTDAVYNFTTA